jgi:hypothetical protein
MEDPPNSPDYKSMSKEDLRKLCDEHKIFSTRRNRKNETMIKALEDHFRKAAVTTEPVSGLKYHLYSPNDLRKFCVQRGILDQNSRQYVRDTYIRKLKAHDRKTTFNFMGLPPELRLMVYSKLLRYQRSHTEHNDTREYSMDSKAYPQILRVSKLCYKEARGILYQQSSLTIAISQGHLFGDINGFANHDNYSYSWIRRQLSKFGGMQYVNVLLQESFKMATYVNVQPRIFHRPEYYLDCVLPALASALHERNALKSITMQVFCTCSSNEEHERRQTYSDCSKLTLPQMEKFKQEFRASSTIKSLPSGIHLEIEGLDKANTGMLEGILKECNT